MTEMSRFLLATALLGACASPSPREAERETAATTESDEGRAPLPGYAGIPAFETKSGILLRPEDDATCDTLTIYFPGHAQEIGAAGSVPDAKDGSLGPREKTWIKTLLVTENYGDLASRIREHGCPVLLLGDSARAPGPKEVLAAMEASEASKLRVLSHSGGYVGLTESLGKWQGSEVPDRIVSIDLLDNFYGKSPALPSALRSILGEARLHEICGGFYTSHNRDRYRAKFRSVCPNVKAGESHKLDVRAFF